MEDNFGLVLKLEGKWTALPLKDVSVEAEIQGYVLGLESTLRYANESPEPAEVVFRFPLEQSHAVVGLTAIIDGRKIKAQLKEKEEARAHYDDALASGQSAALAEEKSGDVFSISLGNLPAGKQADIHLKLVGELGIDAEGSVRFSLPSSLKPRYSPAGSLDPLAGVGGGAQAQVEQTNTSCVQHFQLTVLNAQEVAEVTSPTHTITTTQGNGEDRIGVVLAGSEPLVGDLVILIKHKQLHAPTTLVEGGSSEKEGVMKAPVVMINFFPEFDNVDAACEFIFLVDRSGSMSGGFINSARETLILFLKSLPEGCNFNIIGFGSRYEKLFSTMSVPYTQETLDKATRHAREMQANLGGTELLQPLEYIFREKTTSSLPRQVFVLTDGAVSNTDACITKVRQNIKNSRCFTFGIGSGASTALVDGLAHAGNGTAEFVKEGERLQPKVIRSLKRALQAAVTDISVDFNLPRSFVVQQSPQTLPPIYNGEKMVVYGIITAEGSPVDQDITGKAVLRGNILGKKLDHSVPFTFNSVSTSSPSLPTIHHLAAKALIKDWQDQDKNKEDIVKLSIESSVISSHTAFIAVDEESNEPVAGAMKTWDVTTPFMYFPRIQTTGHGMPRKRRCRQTARRSTGGKAPRRHLSPQEASPKKKAAVKKKVAPRKRGHSRSHCRSRSRSRSPIARLKSSTIDLYGIIAGQQANGSWSLNTAMACIQGKSMAAIKGDCPIECKGIAAAVWATVLILTLLRKKYSSQQDEWELIAMKAKSWVKKQALPSGVTMQDLYSAAKQVC